MKDTYEELVRLAAKVPGLSMPPRYVTRGQHGDWDNWVPWSYDMDAWRVELEARLAASAEDGKAGWHALTDEDRFILTVLNAHRGKALTFRLIVTESVRMELKDRKTVRRLADKTLRNRVKILESVGLVARPPETKKKGISITDAGRQALAVAAANLP
jgi:hypothetical protein